LRLAFFSSFNLHGILYSCLCFLVLVLFVVVIASYDLGEKWRKKIQGINIDASGWRNVFIVLLWIFGLTDIISFLYGMGSIMIVAVRLVRVSWS
jgi:hypothetical protein